MVQRTIDVYFEEHEDSPVEGGDMKGSYSFKRMFLVAYANRWRFLTQLFSNGLYGRPMHYSADWPGLLAFSWDIKRLVNRPDRTLPYMSDPMREQLTHSGSLALVTIGYAPAEYQQEDDEEQLEDGTYATYSQDDTIEFNEVPGRALKWETDDEPLPDDVFAVMPTSATKHVVTWHNVTTPPWALLSQLKGYVNTSAMRLLGSSQTMAPESVMFMGSSARKTFNLLSNSPWEITLNYAEKAQKALADSPKGSVGETSGVFGWNHQFNPRTGEYDRVLDKETDRPLFPTANLNSIFGFSL